MEVGILCVHKKNSYLGTLLPTYLDFFLHNSNFNAFTLTLVIGEEWNFKCFFPANFLTTASQAADNMERYNLFTCQNKGLEKTAAKSSSNSNILLVTRM